MKENTRKKIGLALSGGGARGLAHIGVIKALIESGMPIDYIAGTSMGAVVGGWYAVSGEIESLEKKMLVVRHKDVFPMRKVLMKRQGIVIKGESVHKIIEENFGSRKIEDCPIPFSAIATDVKNGDEVVLKKGGLAEALKASIAIPLIFDPVSVADRLLMDGGASNPVPADTAREMGADYVIAVDVSTRWIDLSGVSPDLMHIGQLFSLVSGSLSAASYQLAKKALSQADIVLRPPVLDFDLLDFDRARELIRLGYAETKINLAEIHKKSGYPEPEKGLFEKFVDFLLYRKY